MLLINGAREDYKGQGSLLKMEVEVVRILFLLETMGRIQRSRTL